MACNSSTGWCVTDSVPANDECPSKSVSRGVSRQVHRSARRPRAQRATKWEGAREEARAMEQGKLAAPEDGRTPVRGSEDNFVSGSMGVQPEQWSRGNLLCPRTAPVRGR